MTITEFVRLNPGLTLADIIKLTGREKSSVCGSLSLLYSQGILTRETNESGNYVYGCNNRLTLMFNQLLREARK